MTDQFFIKTNRVCFQCNMAVLEIMNNAIICPKCGYYEINKKPVTVELPDKAQRFLNN